MRRRLFTLPSAVSVVVFATVLALTPADGGLANRPKSGTTWSPGETAEFSGTGLWLDYGGVTISRITPIPTAVGRSRNPGERGPYFRVDPVASVRHRVAASAALPLPASRAVRRYGPAARSGRRPRLGLCPACGHDLRATPGRCPECGAVPAAVDGGAT